MPLSFAVVHKPRRAVLTFACRNGYFDFRRDRYCISLVLVAHCNKHNKDNQTYKQCCKYHKELLLLLIDLQTFKAGVEVKQLQRNILANPFKRFEDMRMLRHTRTLGIVEVEPTVWTALDEKEKKEILRICEEKLDGYFRRLG